MFPVEAAAISAVSPETSAELGLAPDEAVHVGDNPIADVGGALEAGIRPVLLDRAGRSAGVEAPHRIADLRELVELLEGWGST